MKLVKKLLTFVPTLLLIAGFALIIYVGASVRKGSVPKLFGYSFLIVITDSMEPTYNINEFIIIHEQNEYVVGDAVTFYYDYYENSHLVPVTHRIDEITDQVYTMVGDNPDYATKTQEITKDQIIGKVVGHSVFLGNIFSSPILQNKQILFAIITILLVLFIIYQMITIFKLFKSKEEKK